MNDATLLEIQLLDSNGEYVAAKWSFSSAAKRRVRLGRAEDNEVIVADRFVSRYHAEFEFADGAWRVRSLGRHGMTLGGASLAEPRALEHGQQELQFGGSGLLLRVLVESLPGSRGARKPELTTMLFIEEPMGIRIAIDEADKSRAVDEIANGDFFQALRAVRQRGAEQRTPETQAANS